MKTRRYNRLRVLAYTVLTGLLVALTGPVVVAEPTPKDRADAFIKDLGATAYADRERAMKGLISLGYDARKPVQKLLDSPDPEIAGRAKELWRELRWQVIPGARTAIQDFIRRLKAGEKGEQLWSTFIAGQGGNTLMMLAILREEAAYQEACEQGLEQLLETGDAAALGRALISPPCQPFRPALEAWFKSLDASRLKVRAATTLVHLHLLLWDYRQTLALGTTVYGATRSDEVAALVKTAVVRGNLQSDLPDLIVPLTDNCPDATCRAWRWLLLVDLAIKTDQLEKITPALTAADLAGANVTALQKLVGALIDAQQFGSAKQVLGEEDTPTLNYLRCVILTEEGRPDDANALWREIHANLRKEEDCYSLASLMEHFNDPRAERVWDEILMMAPENSVYDSNAYFKLAPYYEKRGEYQQAADILQRGLDNMRGALMLTNPDGSVVSGETAVNQIRGKIQWLHERAQRTD